VPTSLTTARPRLVPIPAPWTARLATYALFAGNGVVYGTWIGLLPRLREVAGLDDQELGVVLLAVSLGAVAAMPLIGQLAARVGTGRTCLGAALGLGVVLPLPGLATGYPTLIAAAALLGVLFGTLDVAMNAHATRVERQWGAAIMSSFHGVWSTAGLTGAALMGLLLSRGWALPACYATGGIGCALLGVAALWAERGIAHDVAASKAKSGPRFRLPGRALAGVCVMAALSFTMEGGISDWAGIYLRVVLGASVARATIAYQAFAFAMAICRFAGDVVVRRLGPVTVLRFGGLLTIAGVGLGLMMRTPVAAAAAFALAGVGLANVIPVVFSAAGRKGGSPGVAMVATMGYAGLLGGPPLIGFVAQHAGLGAALGLVTVGAVVLIAIARTAE